MPKNRLEAFSDSIIAFAITVLVLEIHIPDLGASVENGRMLQSLVGLLPNFAVYVVSFLVCSVWWISHHNFIHDLHSANRPLLWANNLFLMMIAFLPFPTGLLGHHPLQPVATSFYGLVCSATGFAFWLMRWYASVPGKLMNTEIDPQIVLRRVRISLLSPCCYLAGALLSFVSPGLALLLYGVIPGYFAIAFNHGSRRRTAALD